MAEVDKLIRNAVGPNPRARDSSAALGDRSASLPADEGDVSRRFLEQPPRVQRVATQDLAAEATRSATQQLRTAPRIQLQGNATESMPQGIDGQDKRHAPRTLIVVVPWGLDSDQSKVFDAAQSLITAARKVGVNVVLMEPSPGRSSATEGAGMGRKDGRLVKFRAGSRDELRDAVWRTIAGAPLAGSVAPTPGDVAMICVLSPSTEIGQLASNAINDAVSVAPHDHHIPVVAIQADYMAVVDLDKGARLRQDTRHPQEEAWHPAASRAAAGADYVAADRPDRIALQLATRLAQGDLDLEKVAILRGTGIKQGATQAQIYKAIMRRSFEITAASHATARDLRAGVIGPNLSPAQMSEVASAGRVLLEAGLLRPFTPERNISQEQELESGLTYGDFLEQEIRRPSEVSGAESTAPSSLA